MPTMRPRYKQTLTVTLLATSYVLVYWHRLLLRSLIPFDGNTLRFFYPSWSIGKRFLLDWNFLWDPTRNFGQPFLADPQNQALYPFRFLSVAFGFLDYERVFIVAHVLLAAMFSFLIGQKISQNKSGGALAVVAFAFGGMFLARVTLMTPFAAMAWVPALIWAEMEKKPITLGLLLSCQWMAGFPPFFILSIFILLSISFSESYPRIDWRILSKALCVMLGICAIQWVPFFEMLRESIRPVLVSSNQAFEFSLHPLELFRQIFMPGFLLSRLTPVTNSDPAIVSSYVGPIMLLLFVWAVTKGGRQERILAAASLMAFSLALGKYNPVYRFIPFISVFRFPAHWLLVATTLMVLVAVNGIKHFNSQKFACSIVGLVALDFLIYSFPLHTAWTSEAFFTQLYAPRAELQSIPTGSRVFHSSAITNTIHTWRVETRQDLMFIKSILAPSIAAGAGINESISYDILLSKRAGRFISRLSSAAPESRLFDLAGISKIIDLKDSALGKPIPDWNDVVVFDNADFLANIVTIPNQKVNIIEQNESRIALQAIGPVKVVFTETLFPGWKVWVDRVPAALTPYENTFLSVDVPAGSHSVTFAYVPNSFRIGALITFVTAIFLVTLAMK